jgi:hypothetical protein
LLPTAQIAGAGCCAHCATVGGFLRPSLVPDTERCFSIIFEVSVTNSLE